MPDVKPLPKKNLSAEQLRLYSVLKTNRNVNSICIQNRIQFDFFFTYALALLFDFGGLHGAPFYGDLLLPQVG